MTNTNVTSEAITLADNFFLIEPDGTRLALPINATISMGAGSSRDVVAQSIGTSVFTRKTGQFTLQVEVTGGSGTVQGRSNLY